MSLEQLLKQKRPFDIEAYVEWWRIVEANWNCPGEIEAFEAFAHREFTKNEYAQEEKEDA